MCVSPLTRTGPMPWPTAPGQAQAPDPSIQIVGPTRISLVVPGRFARALRPVLRKPGGASDTEGHGKPVDVRERPGRVEPGQPLAARYGSSVGLSRSWTPCDPHANSIVYESGAPGPFQRG